MYRMQLVPVLTLIMGAPSLVTFILERMPLTDIVHGGVDVTLEWAIVNLVLVPVMLFHGLGLASAIVALKFMRRASSQ